MNGSVLIWFMNILIEERRKMPEMESLRTRIKRKLLTKEFLIFGMIGGVNTVLAQVIYMAAVKQSVPVAAASLIGDFGAMIFSYFMNMRFTYQKSPSLKTALAFPMSYLPGIALSALSVFLVVKIGHGPELWAKLIAVPIYVPINFLCMSLIVKRFGDRKISR